MLARIPHASHDLHLFDIACMEQVDEQSQNYASDGRVVFSRQFVEDQTCVVFDYSGAINPIIQQVLVKLSLIFESLQWS